jgi:vanillate O-demethylase monooxygenase subunit
MGDRAADPAAIPDFSVIDDAPEAHITQRDHILVQAHYQLISDNLLDLSHAIYLHDGILSNEDNAAASVEVVEKDGAVTVSRFAPNARIPGLHKSYWVHATETADKFSSIRWTAPSTLLLKQGICKTGEAMDSGTGYYGVHLLTPVTERSTAYYFTAIRFNVQTPPSADDALNEKLAVTRRFAFAEQDAPVIEAQQRAIDASAQPPVPALLSIDAGPVRCKRILDRLIAAD